MPFELTISDLSTDDDEIVVTGKITAGAYAGPEWVSFSATDGREFTTIVRHHSMYGVQEWPVKPKHQGSLTLNIRKPRENARMDRKKPLIGFGFRTPTDRRADITATLSDPRFWSMYLASMLESGESDEGSADFFGVDDDSVNALYDATIHANWHKRLWPVLRAELGTAGYVEVEYAADVEYQTRFWIGSGASDRTILGYDSGHFSLPAVRMAEIAAIAAHGDRGKVAACLLLPGCRERRLTDEHEEIIRGLLLALPNFRADKVTAAANQVREACTQEDLLWMYDAESGWINNSVYSQRNPKGPMTWLNRNDFERIREFFAAFGAA